MGAIERVRAAGEALLEEVRDLEDQLRTQAALDAQTRRAYVSQSGAGDAFRVEIRNELGAADGESAIAAAIRVVRERDRAVEAAKNEGQRHLETIAEKREALARVRSFEARAGGHVTSFKQLAADIYANAVAHGWWMKENKPLNAVTRIPECLALIHSEVSEALEAYRESDGTLEQITALQTTSTTLSVQRGAPPKPVGFASELADVIIRVLDLCAALGIDIDAAIEQKHAYNKTRPMRHGGKLC